MTFFDFHHHQLTKHSGIYNLHLNQTPPDGCYSAGIHPALSEGITELQFEWLSEVTQLSRCLAIGECGLDGLSKIEDEVQEKIFKWQIELANERNKPLIIHCVRRFSQLLHFKKMAKVPMVIHGYNKRKSIGVELQKHDFYLSFGKSVLQNVNLQEFVKDFPCEKLFLETDDSDIDLQLIYQKVADLKNIKIENLIKQIEENLKIFNIPL
ncbi:TatD family deoxyribonuclease [Chryseobacterium sp. SNU WT5]|uniref:TatD family hydrolase n=1 Tax=Chryseobacterium sp. SNU WT5 TaxID=2594269 RepID=UPI0011800FAE|nr:TatD family hydrolase [Chryseobacterium sp. SNU WT5]QDP85129.1 TatD family deoxyribonuclease [Chryseobacterium sp. SNU WT5]